jgi:hypothetical protein
VVKEIEGEIEGEKEIEKALKEALRAENLLKFKNDIKNRPKKHWIMNAEKKQELKEKSKENLGQ